MTAISLNIASTKSIDTAGIPLDSLPPLEAGRTLPQAFADVLGKASKPATGTAIEGDVEGAGEAEANPEDRASLFKPGTVPRTRPELATQPAAAVSKPIAAGAETTPGTEGGKQPTTGKSLPPARPAIAAPPENAEAPVAPGRALPLESTIAPEAVVPENPVAKPTHAKVKSGTGERIDTLSHDTEVDERENARQAVAEQIALPAMGAVAITAGQVAVASEVRSTATAGKTSVATTSVAAPTGSESGSTARVVQPGEVAVRAAQFTAGHAPHQGDPQAEADTRQPSQSQAGAAPAPAGKPAQEAPQTGLTLQLRAADKPVTQAEVASPANQGTPSTLTQSTPVAVPLASPSQAPIASAVATGPLPHFPELAELVDRIAAARHSAGSATATIAVAHKELGPLSLTFEANGRTLDVEVAAQDSETQRAIAASIAADRPHIKVAEAQAPTQTLHSQLASSAQSGGGSGDARQSGMAGNAQGERGGDARQSGRQHGSGQGKPGQQPKSDGGIYA